MRWSKYFLPTMKEVPVGTEAISHQLLLRAGLVQMLTSGVYSYLPTGLKVLRNIEDIIRDEMNKAGAHELFLPCLHPIEIWKQTGRDQTMAEVMIKFKDGRGREMCLGPTHEEIITDLVKNFVHSYRQIPVTLYQIQTKFRDELRTRFGIVRACEFIMKDAYSFDRNVEGLEKSYQIMLNAYKAIFKRLDLPVEIIAADSGAMGGSVSHEFMVTAPIGEDAVISCPDCGSKSGVTENRDGGKVCPECKKGTLIKEPALELGHIFQLGTKYSNAQEAMFLDEDGKRKPFIMGCYGIGVSRVIAAIIEKYHDDKGIKWPKNVAPFKVEVLSLHKSEDEEVFKLANGYYEELNAQKIDVLFDDRNESPGRKFNDADLIGIPFRITVGQRNLKDNKVEIVSRLSNESLLIDKNEALTKVMELLKS